MIYQVSRDGETSSQSSCQECKRENQHQEHYHEQSSSQEEPLNHSKPLSPQHSKQQQHLLKVLQDQNKRLRLINQDQERQLRDLRHKVQLSKIRPFLSSDYGKSTKQLPRVKMQGQITPKIKRVSSPELKLKSQERQSQIQIVKLEKQIKQLQLKLLQMSNKLRDYEQCCEWMQKFIISFVGMSEQLSLTYGSKLQTRGLSLRKKTKLSWKYMKELINYLIK